MKKLSLINWIYNLAVKIIFNRIVYSKNKLTPEYLQNKGWIFEKGYWIEPYVKERDKIYIEFDSGCFRVRHGLSKTFITLESTIEWFEIYYLMMHQDNGRFNLVNP